VEELWKRTSGKDGAEDFAGFHSRFAPLFGRSEGSEQAGKYLQVLLAPLEGKNSWQLAEALGDQTPDVSLRPSVAVPAWKDVGRKPTQAQVLDDTAKPLPVEAVVAA
jgi:hypothetical protein